MGGSVRAAVDVYCIVCTCTIQTRTRVLYIVFIFIRAEAGSDVYSGTKVQGSVESLHLSLVLVSPRV